MCGKQIDEETTTIYSEPSNTDRIEVRVMDRQAAIWAYLRDSNLREMIGMMDMEHIDLQFLHDCGREDTPLIIHVKNVRYVSQDEFGKEIEILYDVDGATHTLKILKQEVEVEPLTKEEREVVVKWSGIEPIPLSGGKNDA